MARKTLYFDSYCGYVISVATEDGKLCEFNFEKPERGSIIGNIYKGKVECVLPGMQAAFINCGLEKNCYLSADDLLPDAEKYESGSACAPSFPELKAGDEILVQVVKAPVGKKGAKVTANPSLVGKTLIYMPETPFVGVSRKIADEELRHNLIFSAERLKTENEGLIVRTAAPYAKRNQLETEYEYLKNLYSGIKQAFGRAKVGDLLYTDYALPIRVLRDTLTSDISEILVGNEELEKLISNIVNLFPPHSRRKVILHNTSRDMLDELGITKQIYGITSPRADLENGAYLIIEKTEALTVIDVNTGKFTGDDSLEQTVYYTNILAAREIARQVRLRNIGGIVVVDFIDMQNAAHKKALVEELERALKKDAAKCVVSPMSRFGLVEFTRKRVGVSPLNFLTKPCKYCKEAGHTLKEEFILFGLRAKLLNIFADGAASVKVDMNADVLAKLLGWRKMLDELKSRIGDKKLYAVPHKTYHEEQVSYRINDFEIPFDAVEIF